MRAELKKLQTHARHHLRPRHPQPGRGDGAGRPHRGDERRPHRAGGARRARCSSARRPPSSRASWATTTSFPARSSGSDRRAWSTSTSRGGGTFAASGAPRETGATVDIAIRTDHVRIGEAPGHGPRLHRHRLQRRISRRLGEARRSTAPASSDFTVIVTDTDFFATPGRGRRCGAARLGRRGRDRPRPSRFLNHNSQQTGEQAMTKTTKTSGISRRACSRRAPPRPASPPARAPSPASRPSGRRTRSRCASSAPACRTSTPSPRSARKTSASRSR